MKAKERGHLSQIYLTFISPKIRHVLAYLSDIQSRRCLADANPLAPQSAILTSAENCKNNQTIYKLKNVYIFIVVVQQIAKNNQTKFWLKELLSKILID